MKKVFIFIFSILLLSITANAQTVSNCGFSLPVIEFRSGSCTLSADAKDVLTKLAADMRTYDQCSITITSSGSSKPMQKLAICRIEAIQKYLMNNSIAENRLHSKLDKKQDSDSVELKTDN